MTCEQLVEFLSSKMKMSHIYQPLLIRSLVDTGGSATLCQLAQFFLSQDECQPLYYEKRIKEMPLKVLSKHGVASTDGELVHLRRLGDMDKPWGGVNHVVLSKGNY